MSPSNAGATSSSHHHHHNNNNVITTASKTHLRRYGGARLPNPFISASVTPVQLYQSQFSVRMNNNNVTQQQSTSSTNVDNQRTRGMSRQQQVAQQISRQAHKNAKGMLLC
jgi:hypothetical protein